MPRRVPVPPEIALPELRRDPRTVLAPPRDRKSRSLATSHRSLGFSNNALQEILSQLVLIEPIDHEDWRHAETVGDKVERDVLVEHKRPAQDALKRTRLEVARQQEEDRRPFGKRCPTLVDKRGEDSRLPSAGTRLDSEQRLR